MIITRRIAEAMIQDLYEANHDSSGNWTVRLDDLNDEQWANLRSALGDEMYTYAQSKESNVDKCLELNILMDLLENHEAAEIDKMSAESILDAWLQWEGIIGYTKQIVNIYETFKKRSTQP